MEKRIVVVATLCRGHSKSENGADTSSIVRRVVPGPESLRFAGTSSSKIDLSSFSSPVVSTSDSECASQASPVESSSLSYSPLRALGNGVGEGMDIGKSISLTSAAEVRRGLWITLEQDFYANTN